MSKKGKKGRIAVNFGGAVVHAEHVVAHTDDVIHEAELRSIVSQAAAQERAAVAEAKANAAVAATDHHH